MIINNHGHINPLQIITDHDVVSCIYNSEKIIKNITKNVGLRSHFFLSE